MLLLCLLSLLGTAFAETQDASNTTVTPVTPNQLPQNYAGLVQPQVRVNTTFLNSPDSICQGTEREPVHFITTQERDSEFVWYIGTPVTDGMCLFRITEDIDQNNDTAYLNLYPTAKPGVQADGSFPCGRAAGRDSAFFDIPDQIDCDTCVLEFIWKTNDTKIRMCADIMVLGGEDPNCVGQCQHGGICRRGVCVCPPGYTGTYCENEPGAVGKAARNILAIIFWILLAIIIIVLIIILLYWCAKKRIKEGEKEQIYQTNKRYVEFDLELPAQPQGVDRPAELVRQESQSEY